MLEEAKGSHDSYCYHGEVSMSLQKLASRCLWARHAGQLSRNKRHAERRKITAINPPMMFGQAKPVRPTNSAAARTPTFDATSLRALEHAQHVHISAAEAPEQRQANQVRNQRGAAKSSIRPDARGTPFAILSAISK
jgi:hypothetical protein